MKKISLLFISIVLVMGMLGGCGSKVPDIKPDLAKTTATSKKRHVEMETSLGTISLELYSDLAPKAVENFITHAKNGYYDGVTFHRVINDFMIQGGDPSGNGSGGESIWGESFEIEATDALRHYRGAISMANTGTPKSNGSQFFIVQSSKANRTIDELKDMGYSDEEANRYIEEGGYPSLDGKYSVFGYVTAGMDVVDKIAAVEVDELDRPKIPVAIMSIKVID